MLAPILSGGGIPRSPIPRRVAAPSEPVLYLPIVYDKQSAVELVRAAERSWTANRAGRVEIVVEWRLCSTDTGRYLPLRTGTGKIRLSSHSDSSVGSVHLNDAVRPCRF